ncbi:MAG: hypothetical protein M3Y59_03205 [Myxococcota bacterium]|nr:hypothetical protein [Myxococcota bacterium]
MDQRPSYLKAAFLNAYNLSLLGGAAAASLMTGEYVIGAVALGLETMWLLFGPDSRPFQRLVNREAREEREKKEREKIAKLMDTLPEREWARAHALDELRKEIGRDMQQNPSFQVIVLQPELDKMNQLNTHFVNLAAACVRAETYLASTDTRDLQRQQDVQNNLIKNLQDPAAADIARKNAAVIGKRMEMMKEIQNFLARARGQMNLIENSVRLLRDQILTMASPDQLGEHLDDLLTGVEAVQASAKEHEVYSTLSLDPIAPIESEGAASDAARSRVRG